MKLVALALMLAACSKRTDCEEFVQRSRPHLQHLMHGGQEVSELDVQTLTEKCLANAKNADGRDLALMKCVNAAPDDASISACWAAAQP